MEGERKRVYGPTMPPKADEKNVEKAETIKPPVKKVYGPARPTAIDETSKTEQPKRSRSRSPPATSSARESWMTDLKETTELRIDPLNIKARTFVQKGPSLPEKEKSTQVIREELEIEKQVQEYNALHRSKTLQEEYEQEFKEKKVSASEKDRQERIFDWERDMNASVRRMSGKSAQELLNKSTLNDRFGSSSSSKRFL